jgi:glycosyltransferase involved in cell wall biosynthesis
MSLKADAMVEPAVVHGLVGRVLDGMDITDVVYHDYAHSRQLVEDLLFRLMGQVERGGRVLLVGGNSLLAEAVRAAGYELHPWRFGENVLTDDVEERVEGRLTPAMFDDGRLPFDDQRFDAVLLPLVFEHVPAGPAAVLLALTPYLHRDGLVIGATRHVGALGPRLRALLGKPFLPDPRQTGQGISFNWPVLRAYRYYHPHEVAAAAESVGLRTHEWAFSTGYTAFSNAEFLWLKEYARRKVLHLAKRTVPFLRDYIVFSLGWATAEDRRRGFVPAASGVPPADDAPAHHPLVSVVLPTKNRSAMLRDAFAGLLAQTHPAARFEVVLVNDNSTDDTETVARELTAQAPFAVRYVKTTGLGATAARNLGMRQARGEIVAHLDDDCRPVPEWLEEGVRGFGEGVAVVGGPLMPKPEQPVPFFGLTVALDEDVGAYPTANLFLRRDVGLAAGGFDESFGRNIMGRPAWGWDADLVWRLRRRGHGVRFRRGAVAYMEVFRLGPRGWLLDGWRLVALPNVIRHIPELRRFILAHRYFAHTSTLLFDLAVAGLVLAAVKRRPAPLLAAAVWAAWTAPRVAGRDLWPPSRWPKLGGKLGFQAARHAVILAALLAGSVRAKRLVL